MVIKARLFVGELSLTAFEMQDSMPISGLFLKVHIIYVSKIFKTGLWLKVCWRHSYPFMGALAYECKSLGWKSTCLKAR